MHKKFAIPALNLPGTFVFTSLMSLFAVILALVFGTPDRYLCMAAMLISSCGDILLMNFRGLSKYLPHYFVYGALLFMLAHMLYASAYLYKIKTGSYPLVNAGFFTGVALVACGFILIVLLGLKSGGFNTGMVLLCLAYLVIIGANCCVIFSLAFSARGIALLGAAGALSFFISDMIIGIDRIAGISSPLGHELIWWFYPAGQLLILIAG
ncbi:MAG: lysoplasmalogenase family protein [Eubacteriales bacterium]|jgi:uncharacterized membrane protein YhhN|nr:lysoplasmalogenase family protein [Eubacteriales bacterium]